MGTLMAPEHLSKVNWSMLTKRKYQYSGIIAYSIKKMKNSGV